MGRVLSRKQSMSLLSVVMMKLILPKLESHMVQRVGSGSYQDAEAFHFWYLKGQKIH